MYNQQRQVGYLASKNVPTTLKLSNVIGGVFFDFASSFAKIGMKLKFCSTSS